MRKTTEEIESSLELLLKSSNSIIQSASTINAHILNEDLATASYYCDRIIDYVKKLQREIRREIKIKSKGK